MLTQQDVKKKMSVHSAMQPGEASAERVDTAAIPNSAWIGGSGAHMPELDAQMQQKIARFAGNQQEHAESEADRLSAGIGSVRTPDAVKAAMGQKLGADFSDVRFHADASAANLADGIGANAYTTGRDVYFGSGGFDPSTAAHELVHTVQQGAVSGAVSTVSAPAGGVQMDGGFLSKLFGKKKAQPAQPTLKQRMENVSKGAARGMGMGGGAVQMQPVVPAKPVVPAQPALPKAAGHQIKTDGMKFGKAAYLFDSKYRSLEGLIAAYNKDNSAENEAALLDAAFTYVDKNSTGEKAKHKGRTSRAEDIISQITMKGGTKQRADANADRLIANVGHQLDGDIAKGIVKKPDDYDGVLDKGRKTLGQLKGVYSDPKSKYSPAMQMIVADVMAGQDKTTKFNAGGKSDSKRTWLPGRSGAEYTVNGRTNVSSTDSDSLGTTLHEMTHVSVGESYGNTGMFLSAKKGSTKEELFAERDERVRRMEDMEKSKGTIPEAIKKTKGGTGYGTELFDNRRSYALGGKLNSEYAPGERFRLLKELRDTTGGDKPLEQDGRTDKAKTELGAATPSGALTQQHLETMRGELSGVDEISKLFGDEDHEINLKKVQLSERVGALQKERGKFQKDSPDWVKANAVVQKARTEAADFDKASSHSDSLIEYDPVINQMLMQYEHDTDDRDSQHYRQMKAAALRSHVQRLKARRG